MSEHVLRIRPAGPWVELIDPEPFVGNPLEPGNGFGEPGLWRVVRANSGTDSSAPAGLVRVFEAPRSTGSSAFGADVDALHAWAQATRRPVQGAAGRRGARHDWSPPAREEVETWVAPHRLKVRVAGRVARGELVHTPERLALAFPRLADVPDDLAPERRAWLEHLLLEAQACWRLVRFGTEPEAGSVGASSLGAEVDLSGVPEGSARHLVQLSLEALAWAVEWVLSPLSFLLDAGSESRALGEVSTCT